MFDPIAQFLRHRIRTAKALSRAINAEPGVAAKSAVKTNQSPKVALLKRGEWILAIVLSAIVLFLLIVRTTHAGALWRDECESVQWARMPRFADVLANFHYGSFPILFPTIVRTYTTLFGASDLSLRFFGLAVGIAFIGAAWFQSRSITGQVPLLLLALVGLNPNFLTAGTWVRGYGVGSVLIVLAFSLTAKFLLQPTTSRLWAVFLISLASVQCLFFNGALVPAIILAGTVVLLLHRRFKWTLCLLCVAGACATTYIPYLLKIYFHKRGPQVHISRPVSASFGQQLQQQLVEACGLPISVMPWIWLGVVLLSVGGATWRLSGIWGEKPASQRDMLLFGVITICASIPLYYAFIRFVHRPPQARYYLAIFCLAASAADLRSRKSLPFVLAALHSVRGGARRDAHAALRSLAGRGRATDKHRHRRAKTGEGCRFERCDRYKLVVAGHFVQLVLPRIDSLDDAPRNSGASNPSLRSPAEKNGRASSSGGCATGGDYRAPIWKSCLDRQPLQRPLCVVTTIRHIPTASRYQGPGNYSRTTGRQRTGDHFAVGCGRLGLLRRLPPKREAGLPDVDLIRWQRF